MNHHSSLPGTGLRVQGGKRQQLPPQLHWELRWEHPRHRTQPEHTELESSIYENPPEPKPGPAGLSVFLAKGTFQGDVSSNYPNLVSKPVLLLWQDISSCTRQGALGLCLGWWEAHPQPQHRHTLTLEPTQPQELLLAQEDTAPSKPMGFWQELPSVPVGQGETGPSYPGRYKAHRCKCREHLQWPPRSGSTRLPAGSSQNTAAGRTRELT